jgi:hypothetical protein
MTAARDLLDQVVDEVSQHLRSVLRGGDIL